MLRNCFGKGKYIMTKSQVSKIITEISYRTLHSHRRAPWPAGEAPPLRGTRAPTRTCPLRHRGRPAPPPAARKLREAGGEACASAKLPGASNTRSGYLRLVIQLPKPCWGTDTPPTEAVIEPRSREHFEWVDGNPEVRPAPARAAGSARSLPFPNGLVSRAAQPGRAHPPHYLPGTRSPARFPGRQQPRTAAEDRQCGDTTSRDPFSALAGRK